MTALLVSIIAAFVGLIWFIVGCITAWAFGLPGWLPDAAFVAGFIVGFTALSLFFGFARDRAAEAALQ